MILFLGRYNNPLEGIFEGHGLCNGLVNIIEGEALNIETRNINESHIDELQEGGERVARVHEGTQEGESPLGEE